MNYLEVEGMNEHGWNRLLSLMELDFKQLLERAEKAKLLEEENNYLRECIARLERDTNSVLENLGES